jgi:hypothetical protein
MGQAKRRGTYEQRKELAIASRNDTWKRLHPKEATELELARRIMDGQDRGTDQSEVCINSVS